eukprot:1145520-Pelagomonas_calceolata.AAC.5
MECTCRGCHVITRTIYNALPEINEFDVVSDAGMAVHHFNFEAAFTGWVEGARIHLTWIRREDFDSCKMMSV